MAVCLTSDLDQNLMFNLSAPGFGGILSELELNELLEFIEFVKHSINSLIPPNSSSDKKINAIKIGRAHV